MQRCIAVSVPHIWVGVMRKKQFKPLPIITLQGIICINEASQTVAYAGFRNAYTSGNPVQIAYVQGIGYGGQIRQALGFGEQWPRPAAVRACRTKARTCYLRNRRSGVSSEFCFGSSTSDIRGRR